MYKQVLTYTDFEDVEHTETFRFNLSERELSEMQMSSKGGFDKYLNAIVEEQDIAKVASVFKDVILKAYGELAPDGKSFIKKDENGRPLADKFEQTAAFDELFLQLMRDPDKATKFVTEIMPKRIRDEIAKQNAGNHPKI